MAQGLSIHCFDVARGVVAEGMRVAVYACEAAELAICEGHAGADAQILTRCLIP